MLPHLCQALSTSVLLVKFCSLTCGFYFTIILNVLQHVLHLWVLDVMVHTVLVVTTLDQHVLMDTADVQTIQKGTSAPALVSLIYLGILRDLDLCLNYDMHA